MPKMILSMSIATLIYIVATALVWQIWKREKHSLFHRIMVGLFFGGCSIASTHHGIDFSAALLNVRDIGPLAAGLFFDPLSGIIAGLLGGAISPVPGSFSPGRLIPSPPSPRWPAPFPPAWPAFSPPF